MIVRGGRVCIHLGQHEHQCEHNKQILRYHKSGEFITQLGNYECIRKYFAPRSDS
jgi:hypothetical protein